MSAEAQFLALQMKTLSFFFLAMGLWNLILLFERRKYHLWTPKDTAKSLKYGLKAI